MAKSECLTPKTNLPTGYRFLYHVKFSPVGKEKNFGGGEAPRRFILADFATLGVERSCDDDR